MPGFRFPLVFAALTLLVFHSAARSAIETGANPPAADETLIYIMRLKRFAGGGASFWVAVNEQTVDRLSNGRYAVVRARAGRITLNLANAGIVFVSTNLDDRAGETVYLQYRLGDLNFREVSEAEGREFLQKAKRTKGIEAPRPNNEEVDVLSNPARLGFDLTRRASQAVKTDPDNGVITFFRRQDGAALELGVWGDSYFVSTLGAKEGVRLQLPEGDHMFLAGNKGTSILRAKIQAGKEYFVWLDYGEGFGGVRLTPISRQKVKELKRWLEPVRWVELDADRITPRILERGDVISDFMYAQIENPNPKRARINQLGQDHAFDEEILASHEIDKMIASRYDRQISALEKASSPANAESGFIDFSGTYTSAITGKPGGREFDDPLLEVRIRQDGETITGTFGAGGKIWGEVENKSIKFDWFATGGWSGEGTWEAGETAAEVNGTWKSDGGKGKWDLTRID